MRRPSAWPKERTRTHNARTRITHAHAAPARTTRARTHSTNTHAQHPHARTTGFNARFARMERMMADMVAQHAAQMQAVMQPGAAVRQVRWGVHAA